MANPTVDPPSPSSAPPIPLTPGPRATALLKLYTDATSHVLKQCSYPHFSSCFPTPSARVPEAMKALHGQFVEKLGEQLRSEFEGILEERGVVKGLNELDGLVEEARRRRGAGVGEEAIPPHTLPPSHLYRAHLAPSLKAHAETIAQQQEALRADNSERLQRVLQQRKEIAARVQGLENTVKDLDESVAKLGEAGIEDLREEVRETSEGMRGVTA